MLFYHSLGCLPGQCCFAIARAALYQDAIAPSGCVVEDGPEVDVVLGPDVLAKGGDLLDDQLSEVIIQLCSWGGDENSVLVKGLTVSVQCTVLCTQSMFTKDYYIYTKSLKACSTVYSGSSLKILNDNPYARGLVLNGSVGHGGINEMERPRVHLLRDFKPWRT